MAKTTNMKAESIIGSDRTKILKSYKLQSNKTIIASPKEEYDENKIYEEMLNIDYEFE